MKGFKLFQVISAACLFCLALAACIYGIWSAIHSPLFKVEVVEVTEEADEGESVKSESIGQTLAQLLETKAISDLAQIPTGKISLFSLALEPIEKRILTHPWVRSVTLHKKFPQTLSIGVHYREPLAAVQSKSGKIRYIDRTGEIFGKYRADFVADLPVLLGFEDHEAANILTALRVLQEWQEHSEASQLFDLAQISSVQWDRMRGYRLWISYPLKESAAKGRALVELGKSPEGQFDRLVPLLNYLYDNKIAVRHISLDVGKKIVVNIARRS